MTTYADVGNAIREYRNDDAIALIDALNWTPNTPVRQHNDATEPLPWLMPNGIKQYCVTLTQYALAYQNFEMAEFLISQGEKTALTLGVSPSENDLIDFLIVHNIHNDRIWTSLLPLLPSVAANPSFYNHLIFFALNHDLRAVIDYLNQYNVYFSISFHDIQASSHCNEWDTLLLGYQKGLLTVNNFSSRINEVAETWINMQHTRRKLNPPVFALMNAVLSDYLNETPNYSNVLSLCNFKELTPRSFSSLIKSGDIANSNALLSSPSASNLYYDDGELEYLAKHLDTSLSLAPLINLLCSIDDDAVLHVVQTQLRHHNLSVLIESVQVLINGYYPAFLTIIELIVSNRIVHAGLKKTLLNSNTYHGLDETSSRKDFRTDFDWVKFGRALLATEQPLFQLNPSSPEDCVRLIFSKNFSLISPALLYVAIETFGLEQITSLLTHKHQYELLPLIVSPLDAMPYLPKRAQKYLIGRIN